MEFTQNKIQKKKVHLFNSCYLLLKIKRKKEKRKKKIKIKKTCY